MRRRTRDSFGCASPQLAIISTSMSQDISSIFALTSGDRENLLIEAHLCKIHSNERRFAARLMMLRALVMGFQQSLSILAFVGAIFLSLRN